MSPGWPPLPRPRSSILVKVVGALVLALAVSTTVTAVVASHLTSEALADQATRLARSHLSVAQEAYADRERSLMVNARNLAETLNNRALLDPRQRPALIAELGRASGNLELDILRVLDANGHDLEPAAGTGPTLDAPSVTPPGKLTVLPASRLMRTTGGGFVQAVPVAIGSGPDRLVLLAGYEFSDAFAYRLRKQIGSLDDVVLVAGGQMAGSTLAEPPTRPPAQDPGTLEVPPSPKVVRTGDHASLVAYAPVSRSPGDPVGGALGVVLTDPTATLHRSLAQTRAVSGALLALVALGVGWLLFRALIRPLVTLATTAGRVAGGDADATFDVVGGRDEIAVLARSLEDMRVELRARLDLIASQAAELQESSRRIVAAQDGERHRLARDLHDGLQQQLVVLRMQVGMLEDGGPATGSDGVAAFEQLGRHLDQAIDQLREVTHNLYPSILLDRGLAAALHSYVGRLPVSARLRCQPEDFPRLAPELESAAYFLLGEAVTNALKHSGATTIDIGLTLGRESLAVSVSDDGQGFVVAGGLRRGGLLHMEDRVRSFGGSLAISSAPGAGTSVVATFPARAAAETTLST